MKAATVFTIGILVLFVLCTIDVADASIAPKVPKRPAGPRPAGPASDEKAKHMEKLLTERKKETKRRAEEARKSGDETLAKNLERKVLQQHQCGVCWSECLNNTAGALRPSNGENEGWFGPIGSP